MSESWIRAFILISSNSLTNNVSDIKISTIKTLVQLLEMNIVSRISLRDNISTSENLSPLSYLKGLIQNKSSIIAWIESRSIKDHRIQRIDHALTESSIISIKLGAKEDLTIMNNISLSADVVALAM